jgi:hypothetical protein
MLRELLEDCQPGFAEVVLMLGNAISTAEVYTMFDDLRFTPDGKTVTFLAHGGTHLHLKMDQVKEARFIFTVNQQELPSYSLWMVDEDEQPVLRVYLRKSDNEETNQPRHNLFMSLREKYGEIIPLAA